MQMFLERAGVGGVQHTAKATFYIGTVTCRWKEEASPWSANEKAFLQCFSEGGRFPCPNRSACSERKRKNTGQK